MTQVRVLIALLALCLSASGCSVTLQAGRPATVSRSALEVSERARDRCVHGVPGPQSPYREELPGPELDPELVRYLTPFSPEARRAAVAAGLEPLLARLLRAREQHRQSPSNEYFELRMEMAERLSTLETQLTAMEFEVDCVRALLHDTLDEYAESETDRQLVYTIASLVVGAATGVAGGLWDLANSRTDSPAFEDGPLMLSLVGAAATTALGALVLAPGEREIIFMHERNLFAPIMTGEDPDLLFPTFLFRLLTLPTTSGAQTPREELVISWRGLLSDLFDEEQDRALAESVLFGQGGVYSPGLLTLHQELLDQLGAALDALARDVDVLTRAIAMALEDRFDERR